MKDKCDICRNLAQYGDGKTWSRCFTHLKNEPIPIINIKHIDKNEIKISKQDLINKFETLIGYLEYENKKKLDKSLYQGICEEVQEFCEDLRKNDVILEA